MTGRHYIDIFHSKIWSSVLW